MSIALGPLFNAPVSGSVGGGSPFGAGGMFQNGGGGGFNPLNPFSLFSSGGGQEMTQNITNNFHFGGPGQSQGTGQSQGSFPAPTSSHNCCSESGQPGGGPESQQIGTEELLQLIEQMDENGDGEISQSEIQNFLDQVSGGQGQSGGPSQSGGSGPSQPGSFDTADMMQLFQEIDKNGDGEISQEELQGFLEEAGGASQAGGPGESSDSCGCSGSPSDAASVLLDNFSEIDSAGGPADGTISVADLMQVIGNDGDFNSFSPADLSAMA